MDPTPTQESPQDDTASMISARDHDSLLHVVSSASSILSQEGAYTDTNNARDTSTVQAAKAIEAAEDRSSLYAASSRSVHQTGASRPPSIATDTAWTEDEGDRRYWRRYSNTTLPGYEEATASPLSSRSWPGIHNSNLPFGAENDDNNNAAAFLTARKKRSFGHYARRYWFLFCLLNVLVLVIVILVIKNSHMRGDVMFNQADVVPVDSPHHPKNRMHPENFHTNTSECTLTNIPPYRYYGFRKPTDFSFIEIVQPHADYELDDLRIFGTLEIRPAQYNQYSPIEVVSTVATTANWPAGLPSFDFDRDVGLIVELPRSSNEAVPFTPNHDGLKRRREGSVACLSVWVGIYLSTPLENLNIHTDHLNIDIGLPRPYKNMSSLSLNVYEDTHISSQFGNITVNRLNSRRANVTSAHGSIKGQFDMNDALSLETTNGTIRANINHITAWDSHFLDSHPPNTPANLTTKTVSGDQYINVLLPLNGLVWSERLGLGYPYLLNASHQSDSGSIAWAANDYWQGTATAQTLTGSITFRDEEWEEIPGLDNGIPFGDDRTRVTAKRGLENSRIEVATVDGDIDVCVDGTMECLSRMRYPR